MSTGVLAAAAIAEGLYEPHETVVTHLDIKLKRLPAAFTEFRIAQISDIHFNPFQTSSHLGRVVALVNAQKPDMAILTGDFVTSWIRGRRRHASAEQAWPCAEALRKIESGAGCFAVLGNHDHATDPEIVAEALHVGAGITVLRNGAAAIERKGARFWLAGIDNVTANCADAEMALRGVPRQECTLAAVHEPDFADEMRRYPVDFQVSGHSHGGQIRLPMAGALYLPRLARKYPWGHYRFGEFQLYTNRGIGMIGVPMRLLCPPEITVFTLKAGSAA